MCERHLQTGRFTIDGLCFQMGAATARRNDIDECGTRIARN